MQKMKFPHWALKGRTQEEKQNMNKLPVQSDFFGFLAIRCHAYLSRFDTQEA